MKKWFNKIGAGLMTVTAVGTAALMGCADNGSDMANNGVSEETGIALRGSVQVARFLEDTSNLSPDSLVLSGNIAVQSYKVDKIEFCILDAKTFAVSEECQMLKMDGQTDFSLEIGNVDWQYGLLRVIGSWAGKQNTAYQAVVERNNPSVANVNTLTDWKYHQVQKLVESGSTVERAMEHAERDILESIGVYGEYSSFGQMDLSGGTRSDAVLMAATFLLPKPGEFENVADYSIGMVRVDYLFGFVRSPIFWQYLNVERPDEDVVNLVEKYVSNYIAEYSDFARCNEENEGENLPITGDLARRLRYAKDYSLVCEDGLWGWTSQKLEHTAGSMKDSRDGRVYKTTSFTVNGVVQTWMAEDLKYELQGSVCLLGADSLCEKYGRLYTWPDVMLLDTTGFTGPIEGHGSVANVSDKEEVNQCVADNLKLFREDMEEYYDADYVNDSEYALEYDSLDAYKECVGWGLRYQEMLENVNAQNHQGICPDGWRIPTAKDWKLLVEYAGGNVFEVKNLLKDGEWGITKVRLDEYGKLQMKVRAPDAIEFSAVPNVSSSNGFYATIPNGGETGEDDDGNVELLNVISNIASIKRDVAGIEYYHGSQLEKMGVRCIKAE